MLNSRTLFPALFNKAGGGGGGSGQTIQVTELPEAVLSEKDKIYQYIGSTTETLTNGYFYKCVEHTETEGGVITVTYEWENIPVMEAENGYKLVSSVVCDGVKTYRALFAELMENVTLSNEKTYLLKVVGKGVIYHETIRPVNTNTLGFYQVFMVGSTTYTDNILISRTASEVVFTEDGIDISGSVPANGLIIKLFSISVDSAI